VGARRIVVLFVSGLMTIASSLCCARQPSKPRVDGMACVDRLVLPAYPSIASSARLDLHDLTASLQLTADGTVQTVRFEGPADRLGLIGRRLFEPSVESSLRASTFRAACGGQTVTIVFDFTRSEQFRDNGRVSFTYPNRFEVLDSIQVLNP